MIKIRQQQMGVLSAHMRSGFEQRLMNHLRETFPAQTSDMPDETLLETVRFGIQKAESYDIELQNDIRRFTEFLISYGERLDTNSQYPWIAETLQRKDLTGTEKMDVLDTQEIAIVGDSE